MAYDVVAAGILVGPVGVGKSALMERLCHGRYQPSDSHTIGVDVDSVVVRATSGRRIKLRFFDTAGQERFRAITRSYLSTAAFCLLVSDGSTETVADAETWLQELDTSSQLVVRVVNKCDTPMDAIRHDPARYVCVSARSGLGVPRLITLLAEEVDRRFDNIALTADATRQRIKAAPQPLPPERHVNDQEAGRCGWCVLN